MCKGYYTKHFNVGSEPILSYDMNSEKDDNHFIAGKLCKTNVFQVTETRKDHPDYDFEVTESGCIFDIKKYYKTILYSFYSLSGTRVKNLFAHFDFENETITVNGKTLKVVEDFEYTYKVLKTKIKARGGIKGLYKHILEAMNGDSCFNCMTWNVLAHIGGIEE